MAEIKPVEPDLDNTSGGRSMKFDSYIELKHILSPNDWAVFSIVSSFSLFFLLLARHKTNKNKKHFDWLDYLLMGRQLSLPLFVASLVATWYGGIFGVTRIAFDNGIYNFVTQGAFWYLSYIVFAIFLVSKIQKYKSISLADLVSQIFGPKSAYLAALFNFFNVVPIVYCISLGILIQMFSSLSLGISMLLGLIIVWAYASWGGFRAVVYTDFYQFIIMFLGVGMVLILSVFEFGGVHFLQTNLPTSYFSLTGTHSIAETLSWGLIAFSTLVDPNFYQRVFAAKSEKTARNGILLCCLFWFVFDLCTTFGAMYAKAVIPTADPSTAYITYAVQLLPDGLRGLLFAAIVACILSTLDSYIFTASNTLLYDILKKDFYRKKRYHILSHAFVCILSLLLALVFDGNIKSVWKTLGSYSAACLLFPVLFGLCFPKKIRDHEFLIGALLSVFFISLNKVFPSKIDDIYIGFFVSAMALGFFAFRKKKEHKTLTS